MAEIRLLFNTTSLGLQPSDPFLFDNISLGATIVLCDPIRDPRGLPPSGDVGTGMSSRKGPTHPGP